MEHPEKYPQLTIRVSGYAVNFVRLTREQQLDVIRRTFHAALLRRGDASMTTAWWRSAAASTSAPARSPERPRDRRASKAPRRPIGWVHSYETGSTVDGPGVRLMLFMSGCFLRCQYCHNPDTWQLKDGTQDRAVPRHPAPARLRPGAARDGRRPDHLGRGAAGAGRLHHAGSSPPRSRWACTPRSTPRASSATAPTTTTCRTSTSCCSTSRAATRTPIAASPASSSGPTLRFAERLAAMGKPVWVRFVLVPGLTDDPENIAKVARFVAPMKNVEWVEVLPFHQMGAFKWTALGARLQAGRTRRHRPRARWTRRSSIFRAAGCRAR